MALSSTIVASPPPRPYGADRVETGPDGGVVLVARTPKSWRPRSSRTLTVAEYPGTAVEWDGSVYEVRDAMPAADGSVRYRLAPWEDRHAIRRMERYDEVTEAARAKEQEDRRRDVSRRRLSIVLAPLAGLLPGDVQKGMERDFGASATAMTTASAIPLFAAGLLGLLDLLLHQLGTGLDFPIWVAPPAQVAAYLAVESTVRLTSAIGNREPMGSLPVVLAAAIWRELRRHGPRG